MARHYKKTANTLITVIKTAVLVLLCAAALFTLNAKYPTLLPVSISKQIEHTKNTLIEIKKEYFPQERKENSAGGESIKKDIQKDKDIKEETQKSDTSPKQQESKKDESSVIKNKTAENNTSPILIHEGEDKRPLLAIIIDDGGTQLEITKQVAALSMPMTWAIMPYERYTKESAALAESKEIPYLLHLPMQAEIDGDDGPFLIGVKMGREEIREKTAKAMDELPGAVGLNNHRGSRATSDWDVMVPVMDEIRKREMIFVDSSTSEKSIAYDAAKAAGIRTLKNRGFLDGTANKDAIEAKFGEIVKNTVKRGSLVVICHFRPATLLFLKSLDKRYDKLPVRLVTIPEMIKIHTDSEKGGNNQ